jgi:hypothetical protein
MPMNRTLPEATSHQNVRLVPVEPEVKSSKTRELFNAGVSGKSETRKLADPSCYASPSSTTESDMQQYPAGGPREPVYALMRHLGFSMSNWSDKFWHSADRIEVSIFGAGSMARVSLAGAPMGECELDKLGERVDALRCPSPAQSTTHAPAD